MSRHCIIGCDVTHIRPTSFPSKYDIDTSNPDSMQITRTRVQASYVLFIIIADPWALGSPILSLSFLDTVPLLALARVRDHAVNSKGIGGVLFELDGTFPRLLGIRQLECYIRRTQRKVEVKEDEVGLTSASAAPRKPSFALPRTSKRSVFWILDISVSALSSSSTSIWARGR